MPATHSPTVDYSSPTHPPLITAASGLHNTCAAKMYGSVDPRVVPGHRCSGQDGRAGRYSGAVTIPLLACVGPAQHGVRMHAEALARHTPRARSVSATIDDLLPDLLHDDAPVHLHFTDRVFGDSAPAAAETIARLARVRPVSVTLHDIPQPSDGHAFEARRAAYARVTDLARTVIVSSASERHQLERFVTAHVAEVHVDPLPIDPPEPGEWAAARRRPTSGTPTVAMLGFLYPGKGHDRVIAALEGVGTPVDVVALGRPSDGHEDLVPALDAAARALGHSFRATGFLPDAALTRAAQEVTVPVVAPSHVSASGSVGRWIASGRKPLVTPHPFFAELAERAPWALTLTEDLPVALAHSLEHPAATWIDPVDWDASQIPGTAAAAATQWARITGERRPAGHDAEGMAPEPAASVRDAREREEWSGSAPESPAPSASGREARDREHRDPATPRGGAL